MHKFLVNLGTKIFQPAHTGRFIPLYWALGLFIAASTITRLILLGLHLDQIRGDLWYVAPVLLSGLAFDSFMAVTLAIPFVLFLVFMPSRWLAARATRWLVGGLFFAHLFALFYLCAAEIVFFGEFNSRFNYVAVDYLIYPKEVFVNIRDTYPIGWVLAADAVLSLGLFLFLRRRIDAALSMPAPWTRRARFTGWHAVPVMAGALALNINVAQVSDNRVLNEIAGNGLYSFFHAAVNNEVDYDILYARIDEGQALTRVHDLVRTDNARFVHPDDPYAIERDIRGHGHSQAMNVVLVLEESLGSQFVGSLHPEGPSVTPEFDKLSRDGLYFTRIYATGNRTVRGIEASLVSIPPLPGRSLVKRPGGVGVFSLPSVFLGKGYQTAFIYGGRSYFDNLGDFALHNGFERVVDQNDFKQTGFTTVWGVADEELFDHALAEFDAMHAQGKPFFATVLTVSNHTPYTYPQGRIPENPDEQKRENAIKYADYAIGKFMRDARAHAFFENTVFVFLGDHGARVYGRQEIPLESYEIPVLYYAPKLIARGRRVDQLGSQMDVGPTLLGLLDMDYRSQFFGRDLLRVPPERAWALMGHNRDVALMRGDHLAVLGIRGTRELWQRDPRTGAFQRLAPDSDPALMDDAIAYYQSANRLYHLHRLKPQAQPPLAHTRLAAVVP